MVQRSFSAIKAGTLFYHGEGDRLFRKMDNTFAKLIRGSNKKILQKDAIVKFSEHTVVLL